MFWKNVKLLMYINKVIKQITADKRCVVCCQDAYVCKGEQRAVYGNLEWVTIDLSAIDDSVSKNSCL